MFIFYGNKSSTQFLNYTPMLLCSNKLQDNLSLQIKHLNSTVDGGAQVQQMMNIQ